MEREEWSPRTVVAATDGSERSIQAARVATALARRNQATLYIVTVVRPPEGWWGIGGSPPPPDVLGDALMEAQRSVLQQTVDAVDLAGLDWQTVEELGDPAARLVAFCEENQADVLVVGRRGASIVERMVMGSVADRVAHESPCPVLVVP
ncbi:MAG: universal stress protein [Actinomycetota bacterium]|nr:universal stress protein [Actinomycetota bacterium]